MKKIIYFVSLILFVTIFTNCKKENISPDQSVIKTINPSWLPYVGTWKLTKVLDSKGIQQNFTVKTFGLNKDLTTTGEYQNLIWEIKNEHLLIYQFDDITGVAYDFTITQSSNINQGLLYLYNNYNLTFVYQKQ